MRKNLFIIVAAVVAIAFMAMPVTAKKKQAVITFTEESYNFGTIAEKGGKVTHEFKFTNTGDANLVIVDAKAECGCTTPEYPKNPIAPGKSGVIRVTYNPLGRPGGFHKTVTVKANTKPKNNTIKISGVVNPNK
jgi:hypothetical protein